MHPAESRNTRSPGIDLLRILGMLAVVAAHLWVNGTDAAADNVVRIVTFSWPVPLYFLLTGYFWTPGRTVRFEIGKRVRTLIVPYVVFTVIFVGVVAANIVAKHENPLDTIGGAVWGGSHAGGVFSAYWFLPVLAAAAILFRVLARLPPWVSWVLAGAATLASYAFGPALAQIPLDLFFAVPLLLYALIGQQLRLIAPGLKHPMLVGLGFFAVGVALFATRVASPPDLKFGYFGTPVLTTVGSASLCVGAALVLISLFDSRRPTWAHDAQEIASVSVVVLLAHSMVFFVLQPLHLPDWVVYVLAIAFCWLAGIALHRSRLSPLFVGLPQRRTPVFRGLSRD